MRLHCICFGTLKTSGAADLAEVYKRHIRGWAQWKDTELRLDPKSKITAMGQAEAALAKIPGLANTRRFILTEHGRAWSTDQWIEEVKTSLKDGLTQWAFLIGPADGWGEKPTYPSQTVPISFGPQTVSHELSRILLYEQMYRALSAINHHPYHRA
jgi:23S rRNA (pseudouridine1915-N3)-methyltransferase